MRSAAFVFALVLVFSVGAQAQTSWVNWDAMNLVGDMDKCAHNDAGKIGTFDPKTFNASVAASSVVDEQEEGRGVCRNAQRKVLGPVETAAAFRDLAKNEENFAQCIATEWAYPQVTTDRIADFIADPTNLMVLGSLYTEDFEEDELNASESCMYYNFYVYRANGTAVKFTVNYTD